MSRQSFNFKGTPVHLYDTKDGWRFYKSEDESLSLKCKGLSVQVL